MKKNTSLVTCILCQNHERLERNVTKYICPTCTAKNIRRFEEKKNEEALSDNR